MSTPDVLIVDDDRLLRTMLKDALADVPCTVREADSGDAALAAVADKKPAVMLLDLIMPGKSGLDLLKTFSQQKLPMRIVVISSLDTESLVQQALADGAHGFLSKPFHPLDVQNVVRAALEAAEAGS
ncbi:MAG: response regulator [Archangiaceae bacterium]|nr:response regulator [Archangiaceae bacterium]